MPKSIPAALKAHLQQEVTTLATCWKVTRKDGQVYGFTTHSSDLVVDGVTYKASTGFLPTTAESAADLSVDNMECTGIIDSVDIKEEDILAGKWDGAKVEIFMVNWQDPSMGKIILPGWGWIGEITLRNGKFVAEVRGLAQALQQTIVELISPLCRANLGDNRCKVRLDPPAWAASTAYTVRDDYAAETGSEVKPLTTTSPYRYFKCVTAGTSGTTEPAWDTTIGNQTTDGTVVWECYRALQVNGTVNTVTDRSNFSADLDSQDDPDGFFSFGVITFTSGKNNGVQREVKQHTSSGANPQTFILYEPLPFDLQVGDTFTVTAGCDKTLTHCRDKFNNTYNRRAEDFVPGQDALMKFGGQ